MTRFARAAGSKSSNERVPEDATSWNVLKHQIRAKVDSARSSERVAENEGIQGASKRAKVCMEEKLVGSERCIWAEFSTTHDNRNKNNTSKITIPSTESSTSKPIVIPAAYISSVLINGKNNNINGTKLKKKRKNSGNNSVFSVDSATSCSIDGASKRSNIRPDHGAADFKNIVLFEGFNVRQRDAERLKLMKQQLSDSNLEKEDVVVRIKQERRKAEKTFPLEKKKVCFNCRKPGHTLINCLNLESSETQESMGAGICFKCGSTEHKLSQCRISGQQEFQYAQCFICNQHGHIAKECPDNPRGLYPHGGACKVCGDVTHLKKDCPSIVCRNNDPKFMLGTINDQSIEGLDEEIHESLKNEKKSVKKRVIKF